MKDRPDLDPAEDMRMIKEEMASLGKTGGNDPRFERLITYVKYALIGGIVLIVVWKAAPVFLRMGGLV